VRLVSVVILGAVHLSRNTKQALPRLKDVGDLSAHSRRYIAQRKDIDKLVQDLRVVVQELVTVAELKK
jgi:ribosomal protein L11